MKILFLSSWFPYPPGNGSKIRIYSQIKELSKNNEIHLISFFSPQKDRKDAPDLKKYCASISPFKPQHYTRRTSHRFLGFLRKKPAYFSTTYTPEIQEAVDKAIGKERPDLIFVQGLTMAEYILLIRNIPRVLDLHNVDSLLFRRIARYRPSILKKIRAYLFWLKFRGYERKICEQFDLCLVTSESEKRYLLSQVAGLRKAEVIPNAVDYERYANYSAERNSNTIIFTGTLTYGANLDALNYFYHSIFPLIKEEILTVKLVVTGDYSTVNLDYLASDPNVELTGYVEDVRPLIASSTVSIAPIRIGGGSRYKILESMALGTPVVSTSIGAEGIDVTHGENILIADNPDQFAHCIQRTFKDRKLLGKMSKNAKKLIAEKYNWKTIGNKLNALLLDLAGDQSSQTATVYGKKNL